MTSATSLIDELEGALTCGNGTAQEEIFSRITDLFIAGSEQYSARQIALFDDLIGRLVAVMEVSARARLADRLATLAQAPTGVIRMLAFDDNIKVARPVLSESSGLADADLIVNANTKSQQHLAAISERSALSEAVTDVLVARGDLEVVHTVAENASARFSFAGFRMLVRRASDDDALAMKVGARPDLPRHHMQRLLDAASETVRHRLMSENFGCERAVEEVVAAVGESIRSELAAPSFNYTSARAVVEPLHRADRLDEATVGGFARQRRFEETVIALALLCQVEIETVESALRSPGLEIRLILVKLAGLSWPTAKAILQLREADREMSSQDIEVALANFGRLNAATARRVLGFYRMRTTGFAASDR
jgi:uncharacterized protein (DUF2336 family)